MIYSEHLLQQPRFDALIAGLAKRGETLC